MTLPADDLLDRAAALALASDRPWAEVTLRDIAAKGEVPLADLYAYAPGKAQVIDWLSRRFDLAALKAPDEGEQEVHDRLFEAVMRRVAEFERTLSHFRDKDQNEVDIILEVKASATVRNEDFGGLRKLAEAAGSRFAFGAVLYDHDLTVAFGDRLVAAPLSCLWG